MPRIGVEISPDACRIVEIDSARGANDTIVRSFTRAAGPDAATLAPYRRQRVAVVMWGLPADHRQAVVTYGSYRRMRREAVNATRQAGVDTRQMLADIVPVTKGSDGGRRRPVVVALARSNEVAAALRPFTAAGVKVRSIVTPALALMSLARLRSRLIASGMIEAYVALEEATTAIALVRDGALIAARELAWGFQNEQRQIRSRDEVSGQLGAAIQQFFEDCGARPSSAAQVCVCGGMPELRSMTLALTQSLDVEVEPLDSLFGIDEERLPAGEDFRDRASEMRLAWAAAADRDAPINFLRERRRRLAKSVLTRAAVVAGVATGLGIAWRIGRSALLEPATPASKPQAKATIPAPALTKTKPVPAPRVAAPPPPARAAIPPPAARAATPSPAPAATPPPAARAATPSLAPAATPPPLARAATPPPAPAAPPPLARPTTPPPAERAAISPPSRAATLPPARVETQPPLARAAVPPPVVLRPVPEPSRRPAPREPETSPAASSVPTSSVSRVAPPPEKTSAVGRAPAPKTPPAEEVPLPFEAALGTILYGADRKLAIIDGRIVQVGDEVRGARVTEITQNSVFFRDGQGRLRRLSLEGPGR